ncbi:KdsC family phosphatase [Thiococcus pfennigii]|jgi:3-deoxy-D-manno-octulosonate 8-phosphate phosphatase (KDO 8-P phosphatase)|uniref:KdsC family phosphatase n=1 Tax=Thiococcus pfennigii TaxID=1057 RepID=UPI0019038E23|nr:HAD-IIIA family hydrolase [Thiococcus pfennigii]MBK1701593.1 3-deoxy-D-manno-octulosonate 8-phosphate phosphatase [Thiococcus pfennigii]MBK1731579.1 3-deoxy-D-manno-octulosonate 8-phosphate phosphatase [Thiococcus pfennigii]
MDTIATDTLTRARAIRLVVFDVDGVLTDGRLYFDADGREYKAFHSRDGHGLVMLQRTGVQVAIVTGRHCEAVRARMAGLGIAHVHQGCQAKAPVYAQLKRQLDLPDQAIACVGDDVVDLPILRQVGFAIAPADAHPLVAREAHWQTPSPGGRGAAREVCDLIMEAQGTLAAACG